MNASDFQMIDEHRQRNPGGRIRPGNLYHGAGGSGRKGLLRSRKNTQFLQDQFPSGYEVIRANYRLTARSNFS